MNRRSRLAVASAVVGTLAAGLAGALGIVPWPTTVRVLSAAGPAPVDDRVFAATSLAGLTAQYETASGRRCAGTCWPDTEPPDGAWLLVAAAFEPSCGALDGVLHEVRDRALILRSRSHRTCAPGAMGRTQQLGLIAVRRERLPGPGTLTIELRDEDAGDRVLASGTTVLH